MMMMMITMLNLMIILGPEYCVLELVSLKTTPSDVNACHDKVPLAEIKRVLTFVLAMLFI